MMPYEWQATDGGKDQLLNEATMRFLDGARSASSVALPKATLMLALSTPPRASGGGEVVGGDPFAASVWPSATFLLPRASLD
ncbi:uncharacterized protein A4U43_C06F5530 [Asparagus officinalis]|uniref:Uncharacterized protein n=1 Tax=Asparagus officinalis TaxID=4686 RepID=A0A5P1EK10_ASPOF|nr:uncharacterized protein A4U43_C06F5530 [Asparagus officinalis]